MDLRPVKELTGFGIELVRRMILRWYITVMVVSVCMIGGIGYARHHGIQYITTMTVIPADLLRPSSSGSGSAIGGAASLFGVSLGGGTNPRMQLYLELLQSPVVAQALIDKYHYDRTLFKGAIDPATGKWKDSFARRKEAFYYRLFGLTLPDRPTVQDVAGAINGMLVLDPASDGPGTKVDCVSSSPDRCRDLLVKVNQEAQAILNRMSFNRASSLSKYLAAELPNMRDLTVRDAMANMLASAQRDIALSSLNQSNIAAVLEPPMTSNLPDFPQPHLVFSLSFMLGIALGAILTWFSWGYRWGQVFELARNQIRGLGFRRQT